MLKATHNFRVSNSSDDAEALEAAAAAQPCRFLQVSAFSWRLDRGIDITTSLSNASTDQGNSQLSHQSSVVAFMNQFLTQQCSIKHQPNKQPKNTNKIDDLWVQEIEEFLNAKTDSEQSTENIIYHDRNGVIVSSPLRLCPKTLTKSLLKLNERFSSKDSGSEFCLQSLIPGGERAGTIEFSSYQEHQAEHQEEGYIPAGYEAFEGEIQHQNQQQQNTSSSNVYYIMELKNIQQESSTTVEDLAIVWKDKETNEVDIATTSSWGSRGVQIKFIPTDNFRKVVSQTQETGDRGDFFLHLENEPALSLPQPLPSMIAIISFSTPAAEAITDRTESDSRKRLLAQLEASIHTGCIVLRFHRSELVHHPLSSYISLKHFCIGRNLQIIAHSESQEAEAQKLLEGALLKAERFVPAWKQQQWDTIPDVLLMVNPHPGLPHVLKSWLLDPLMRRSNYDLSLGNVLLCRNYWQHLTPPYCHYVDKYMVLGGQTWDDIHFVQHALLQNVAAVQANASLFNDQQRRKDRTVVDARTLEEMCSERGYHPKNPTNIQHMADICERYLQRILTSLAIERLRCLEDMKKHDMYSILWNRNQVEIPPPWRAKPGCVGCNPQTQGNGSLCHYHLAAMNAGSTKHVPGKSIPIRTKQQLELLPLMLQKMDPEDSLVVRITVPGVAEDYPLVSIGDFVRLFFRGTGVHTASVTTEIHGEVTDVVVKTEEVTIRLPSPYQIRRNFGRAPDQPLITPNCLPYLQALLHTNDAYLDALPIVRSFPNVPPPGLIIALDMPEVEEHEILNGFRFDLRFGFLGGRGFDIINQCLSEAMNESGYHIDGVTKKKAKKPGKKKKSRTAAHLTRCLAPTQSHLGGIAAGRIGMPAAFEGFRQPLNAEQGKAVMDITFKSSAAAPYIIEGPAGTGKSMCVCEAILQVLLFEPKAKILVCAPSDAACDVLASRLLNVLPQTTEQTGMKINPLLRLNWWSRKVASLPPALLSVSPMDELAGLFTLPPRAAVQAASVVVCQCFVAESLNLIGPRGWSKSHFTHLFIDETSQAMECEALIPMLSVGPECSIVLAGDPKQLGPTIRDPVAARAGLGISIQERLLNLPLYQSGNPSVMTRLVANYRSNEALLTVPSSLFYGGSLQCLAPPEVANPFEDFGDLGPSGFPLLMCNCRHGKERSKLDTPSFFNMEEANAIMTLIQGLLNCKTKDGIAKLHSGQIAVITPFRAQVLALRTILRASNLGGINVGVVEDFQGQEAKVVFISTVLTQNHDRWSRQSGNNNHQTDQGDGKDTVKQRLGFMHDPKRFNVAITRAQALCVIVGHADYLEQSGTYWTALIEHIRRNDGMFGEETGEDYIVENGGNEEDKYGVAELLRRVEELKLLGSGFEEDKHDLSFYYSDVPQWKVMLN